MMPEEKSTFRTTQSAGYFALEGYCQGLRIAIERNLPTQESSFRLYAALEKSVLAKAKGTVFDDWPAVEIEKTSVGDLLVRAETFRSLLLAFVTPEERDEARSFGLRPNR